MRTALLSVLFCMYHLQLNGHSPYYDTFDLETIFQDNFQAHLQDDTVPVLLGYEKKTGCICKQIPEKQTICFGLLSCTTVPHKFNITTPAMKLTTTEIKVLSPGDFEGYYHLESLQIDGNIELTEILPGTFSNNFTNLMNLSISFNTQLRYLHVKTFELLHLSHLFMIKNGFQNLPDITAALVPKFLPRLFRLSLCQNNFVEIGADDFKPLENSTIQELTLVLCRIENIDPEAFVPLKHLQLLRLGENRFDVNTITRVVEKIAEHDLPIKVLNLVSAGFRNNMPKKLMEAIARTNISYLNIAKNQFETLNADSFPYMPNIEGIDLRSVLALEVTSDAFDNLPNLKTLLLAENNLQNFPEGVLIPTLTNLDLQRNSDKMFGPSYFFLCEGCLSKMTSLVYLNLNFNNIHHLYKGSFQGLTDLRILTLKNDSIYHIQNFTFRPLQNLILLNLENNDFVRRNDFQYIWPDVFGGLENLRVLLLGGCGIVKFAPSGNTFVHLKSIVYLGLQNNALEALSPDDLAPLRTLQSIDLSYNYFKVWDVRIFLENQLLSLVKLHHNKLTHMSEAMFEDFSNLSKLELKFNSFTCNCYTFLQYSKYKHRYENSRILDILEPKCLHPLSITNYTLGEYLKNVENNTIICDIEAKTRLIIMLPLIILAVLFVTLLVFVYFYRWHIKYWMFLTRLYLSRKGKMKPNKKSEGINNYHYDAFISYSTEDRNFVLRLASMLENYEPYLKLCIYERDFEIGAILSESILQGVAQSRKTILIISDNYAKSPWCRWESHLAEHHRLFFENLDGEYVDDTLILVKLGPVSNPHLTPMLRYLLKTRIYLQWEVDEKKQKVFWDRMRTALSPPPVENTILESTHI